MSLILTGLAAAAQASAPAPVEGVGMIRSVNVKAMTVRIAHEPMPALKWPAMTMDFKVADPQLLANAKVGAKVRFTLQGRTVTAISPG